MEILLCITIFIGFIFQEYLHVLMLLVTHVFLDLLQDQLDPEVKLLLSLKADFKAQTGKDWKPGMSFESGTTASSGSPQVDANKASELSDAITAQGNKVRDIKAAKASKVKNR